VLDFFKVNAKAVATFVLAIILQAITDIIQGTAGVAIFDWQGVLRYIGLALLAGVGVWVTGNKLDSGQVLSALPKMTTGEQAKVAKGALTELPNPVSDKVVENYPNWVTG
jgi:hypothetical protein